MCVVGGGCDSSLGVEGVGGERSHGVCGGEESVGR